jgi:hypothetical protein
MSTKEITSSAADEALKASLSALETSLATPVVSGELVEWLTSVRSAWAQASAQIDACLHRAHPAQFDEIGGADPELLPRVEQLQTEDAAIAQNCQAFGQAVARTADHVPKLEPDEEKAAQHVKKLVDQGMALVTQIRKQEVAIQTWFIEAFNRDRGSVD